MGGQAARGTRTPAFLYDKALIGDAEIRGPINKRTAMRRVSLAIWALLTSVSLAAAQTPTADDVKSLRAKYAEEKAKATADNSGTFFLPGLVERADELAARADQALGGNRLFQAAELYRQARWQLPYLPGKLPPHVAKVFGGFRLRHTMEVTAAAYSPDGKYLATGGADRSVKLWDLGNGREAKSYSGLAGQARAVAFSPDGKLLAIAGVEPDIHLWSPETGELLRKITGPGTFATSLAFSRDGKTLVASYGGKAGGSSGYVALADVASGEVKRVIQDFRLLVHAVRFNTKGDILAVGVADGATRLYQFPKILTNLNEPEYWSHQENTGPTYDVAFSADDTSLIRAGADGLKVYAVPPPGEAFKVSAPRQTIANPSNEHHFSCVRTSADSKTIIAGATDGTLRIIDANSGQIVSALRGHAGPMRSIALHPTGGQIASAGADCMARLWDFDIVLQARDYAGHDGPTWSAAFDADGKRVVSASGDGTIRLWDVGNPTAARVLKGHAGPVTLALFSPDGKHIVSAGADRLVKIWAADTGALVRDLAGHTGTVTALDVTPDGKKIVSGGSDRLVKIWDTASGKEAAVVESPSSVPAAIAVHPAGDKFAVGNVDQTIALYDISGKLLKRWPGHGIAVSGVAFSPDGKLLASCGADMAVRVWSVDNPASSPITLAGHTGPLSGVAFRKDSQHLVSCGADLSVKLWKLEGDSGKEVQTYRGHKDWVSSCSFSKDGYYVVSASVDRTVKIWEITSRDMPILPEHTGTVDTVAFSPDGTKIATGSSDRTIKIWDRATGRELSTIRGHASNVISLTFTPDGKTLISSGADQAIRFWNPATGKELPRSTTQQQSFTQLVNSSPLISTAGDGKTLLVWIPAIPGNDNYTTMAGYDLEGNEKFTFNDQGRKVYSLCFSADGKRAATGAANGSVRVWDLQTRATLPGGDWFFFDPKVAVADLGLTPKGDTIVVTSEQGDIKIADVAKREVLKTIKGHPGRITACVISPDAKRFATLDAENTIKLWDLASGDELRKWDLMPLMQDRPSGVVSLSFSPDGRQLAIGNSNTTMLLLENP
jgi:WD40 repeat protein